MKYFVVSIGGTGSREAEMLVHFAAIGMLEKCDELMVYFVDADEQNGDTSRLQNVIHAYNQMRHQIVEGCEGNFSHDFMRPHVNMKSFGIRECIISLGGGAENPKYLDLARDNADRLSTTILDLLHPKFDQAITLEHGFYGDPAMGAAIFNAVSQTETFQKSDLFRELEQALGSNAGADLYLLLTGSVFGGTGAALFPNLAQEVRKRFADKRNLHIGGALFLPYFSFPSKDGATVTSKDFLSKTAAALDSYSSWDGLVKDGKTQDYIFDALWLCGYPEKDLTSDINVAGGSAQIHRHHFVELLAALLSCQFFSGPDAMQGDPNKKQLYTYRLDPKKEKFDWDVLPPELKGRMSAFARFCILLLTTVRGLLSDPKAPQNPTLRGMFGTKGFFIGGTADCDVETIRKQAEDAVDYCRAYLLMLTNLNRYHLTQVDLVDVNALQNVLNRSEQPLSLEDAHDLCKLQVVPDGKYTRRANDFTETWGSFRGGREAADDITAMKYLYAKFYEMCCEK